MTLLHSIQLMLNISYNYWIEFSEDINHTVANIQLGDWRYLDTESSNGSINYDQDIEITTENYTKKTLILNKDVKNYSKIVVYYPKYSTYYLLDLSNNNTCMATVQINQPIGCRAPDNPNRWNNHYKRFDKLYDDNLHYNRNDIVYYNSKYYYATGYQTIERPDNQYSWKLISDTYVDNHSYKVEDKIIVENQVYVALKNGKLVNPLSEKSSGQWNLVSNDYTSTNTYYHNDIIFFENVFYRLELPYKIKSINNLSPKQSEMWIIASLDK